MASLKLEILRHGTPHQQPLSAATDYVALCANQPASIVRVPFEHAELVRDLRALAGSNGAAVVPIAARVGEILAQVPGLIAECSRLSGGGLLHLRLVLSANELALLPFELAQSPIGFPGAGQHLALQTAVPICITREVRRSGPRTLPWPSRSKILFAWASPGGLPTVPHEEHWLALLNAVDPWIPWSGNTVEERQARYPALLAEHVTVIEHASLRAISDACRTGSYTHVHLLAHGLPLPDGDDRVGLALHDDADPDRLDVVDGERLATALRMRTAEGDRALSWPSVVTLASCDSGKVGAAAGPGASLAHELHAAGIPLVIASQFPLSFTGSVYLCKTLYRALLLGDDPRVVLDDVRRELRSLVAGAHDWASLVAYASLPVDLDRQLRRTKRDQAERAIFAALTHLDAASHEVGDDAPAKNVVLTKSKIIDAAEKRVREPFAALAYLLETREGRDTDLPGLLASAKKRLAEVYFRASRAAGIPAEQRDAWREASERYLREAHRHYGDVFEADRAAGWALVQRIVLGLVIGREPALEDRTLARLLAQRDRERITEEGGWANRNLIELALIERFYPEAEREHPATPHAHLADMLARSRPDIEQTSLRLQLDRYRSFFGVKIREEADKRAQGKGSPSPLHAHRAQFVAGGDFAAVLDELVAALDDHDGRASR